MVFNETVICNTLRELSAQLAVETYLGAAALLDAAIADLEGVALSEAAMKIAKQQLEDLTMSGEEWV
jgi:hypothetical protein